MSKQYVYFTCFLFTMAALLAASAQEDAVMVSGAVALNNTTSNMTTSNATSNESIIAPLVPAEMAEIETNETLSSPLNASPAIVDQDESNPAGNQTVPTENLTSEKSIAPAEIAVSADAGQSVMTLGGSDQKAKPERAVYAIGEAAGQPGLFAIGKQYLPDQAYKAGMSAETIMDLSALPFYTNHM